MSINKSKPTEEYDDPGESELYSRMKTIPSEEHRAYLAFTYLIGNRVSEGVPGKSKYHDSKTKGKTEHIREYSGIRKKDITFDERGWMEVSHIPTLKRKVRDSTKFYREGIVFTLGKGEEPFINIVRDYMNTKQDEEILWTCGRKTYWQISHDYLKIPPKKLRGLRATKDAKTYNLGALELKEKYNWGSTDMPFHYAKFNKQGMKDKMEKAGKTTSNPSA